MATATRSLIEIVRLSTTYLADHGADSARLDAELLAARALGLRRLDLYLQFDRPLDDAELTAIRGLVRRRGQGEPVAYITGEREFYGRAFTVTPAVLIPRPDTETLVERVLSVARSRGGAVRVTDLGTGSGCIAVTLAAELPDAQVVAVDVSPDALAVAAINAERHGVSDRVEFRVGGWDAAGEHGDLVVSNPPYITSSEMTQLARDVIDHEPGLALEAGEDGLDAYRALLAAQADLPPDWIGLEVDPRRADQVAALISARWPGIQTAVVNDLTGRSRVVEGRGA